MWKTKVLIRSAIIIFFVSLILSGCLPEKPAEDIQPQGEQTSGPIPIQIEATEMPSTAAPTETPPVPPTDTPSSSENEPPTETPVVVPDEPTTAPIIDESVEIQLDWDIYSVALGTSETIRVEAVNSNGEKVPFSIQKDRNCVAVAFDMDSITLSAGNERCEQVITVKAANAEEKTLKVIVFDPMVLDIGEGLLIRYVDDYTTVWDDRNTGCSPNLVIQHPDVVNYDDWYPLGDIFHNLRNQDDFRPTILVKDSMNAGLLSKPLDYVGIWNDSGTGATYGDTSIWKAVCETGSVAFGVIANNSHSKPSTDAMRCVREDYTMQGKIGSRVWHDGGSGKKDGNFDVYTIEYDENLYAPDGKAMLLTGNYVGCPNYGSGWCDLNLANVLLVPLPVYKHATNNRRPQLTGPEPFDSSSPRFFSAVRVPFTMIPSQYANASQDKIEHNIALFPFYYVLREEKYINRGIIDNLEASSVQKHTIIISKGIEEGHTTSFSQSVGITVEVGGDVGFLGAGGSWSVSMSYQYSWEETYSYTTSEFKTTEDEFLCNPGKYCQYLQVTSQFRLARMDGTVITSIQPFNLNTNITKILEYPPPD